MSNIAIIGAGQSGLQLALTLQNHGHEVTVYSDRSDEAIAQGFVMSTQCMFHDAMEYERQQGIDFWSHTCPPVVKGKLQIAGPDGLPALAFTGSLDQPAFSVDQRVKIPAWMKLFAERGGDLRIARATIETLEELAQTHDLVIVASGKGELGALFERDPEHSPYDTPQRVLSLVTVHGYASDPHDELIDFTIVPEHGEYIIIPGMTKSGPCHFLLIEAIPGGLLDRWDDIQTPEQQLQRTKELVDQLMPWKSEQHANVYLTDDNGVLKGRFAPTVRKPIGKLPSGRIVLGMADAVVLNDPITGQGSNNASKAAAVYADAILNHDGAFDEAWMQATFDRYWEYVSLVTVWTNGMLQPPPEHMVGLFAAAAQSPMLANRFMNGFNHPPSFFPWLVDPVAAQQVMAEVFA